RDRVTINQGGEVLALASLNLGDDRTNHSQARRVETETDSDRSRSSYAQSHPIPVRSTDDPAPDRGARAGGLAGQLGERTARALRPGIAGPGVGLPRRPDRLTGGRRDLAGPAGLEVEIPAAGGHSGSGGPDPGRRPPGGAGRGGDPAGGRRV